MIDFLISNWFWDTFFNLIFVIYFTDKCIYFCYFPVSATIWSHCESQLCPLMILVRWKQKNVWWLLTLGVEEEFSFPTTPSVRCPDFEAKRQTYRRGLHQSSWRKRSSVHSGDPLQRFNSSLHVSCRHVVPSRLRNKLMADQRAQSYHLGQSFTSTVVVPRPPIEIHSVI